ncbi:hypothetical protein [Bacillus sp. KH172YL63]|uniref:hypothetical protein n=1 Tax=Bacillus sp. KH172YL63 TaxID=2709784 RepID=UPI0013E4588F|nr:hypothetical protein [Bacillus sp. KH172YL63]BCB03500.1 hypothetical protein KH172YL63_16330 [Bacillus sp. KH172YL63]
MKNKKYSEYFERFVIKGEKFDFNSFKTREEFDRFQKELKSYNDEGEEERQVDVQKASEIKLLGVYDNPDDEDRYTITFKVDNGEVWEFAASEDDIMFAMDVTTANDVDNGKEISFDELPEIVKDKVLAEWEGWNN